MPSTSTSTSTAIAGPSSQEVEVVVPASPYVYDTAKVPEKPLASALVAGPVEEPESTEPEDVSEEAPSEEQEKPKKKRGLFRK